MTDSGSRGPGRLAVVAIVVLVVLLLGVLVVRQLRAREPDTLVVGDSVTFLSASPIQAALGTSRVKLVALPGYRSLDILHPAEKAADGTLQKKRAVFLVGYNDVMRHTVDSKALPSMLDLADSFPCAVWLTLPARPSGAPAAEPRYDPGDADAWNARVVTLAKARPHVHVSEAWSDAVDDAGRAEADTLVQPDGVHPNAAGQQRLAQVMKAELDAAC